MSLQELGQFTKKGYYKLPFRLHMVYAHEKGAEIRDPCLPNGDSSLFHIDMEELFIMGDAKIVFGPECSTKTIWSIKREIVDDFGELMRLRGGRHYIHEE